MNALKPRDLAEIADLKRRLADLERRVASSVNAPGRFDDDFGTRSAWVVADANGDWIGLDQRTHEKIGTVQQWLAGTQPSHGGLFRVAVGDADEGGDRSLTVTRSLRHGITEGFLVVAPDALHVLVSIAPGTNYPYLSFMPDGDAGAFETTNAAHLSQFLCDWRRVDAEPVVIDGKPAGTLLGFARLIDGLWCLCPPLLEQCQDFSPNDDAGEPVVRGTQCLMAWSETRQRWYPVNADDADGPFGGGLGGGGGPITVSMVPNHGICHDDGTVSGKTGTEFTFDHLPIDSVGMSEDAVVRGAFMVASGDDAVDGQYPTDLPIFFPGEEERNAALVADAVTGLPKWVRMLELGTSSDGGATLKVNYASGKYIEMDAAGKLTCYESETKKMEIDMASQSIKATFENANVIEFASSDFGEHTGKTVKLRELSVLNASGQAKVILAPCSEMFDAT